MNKLGKSGRCIYVMSGLYAIWVSVILIPIWCGYGMDESSKYA